MTHTKGNFDQIRNTRRAFCSHLIIKLSSSFIFCCDIPLTPLKGSTKIAPTGVRFRFNAGTTLKLYSLTDGRQKSSGRPGFLLGGGGWCGERGVGIRHFEEAMTRSNQLYCTQNNRRVYFQIDFPRILNVNKNLANHWHQKPATRKKYSRCFDSIYF